MKKLLPFLLLAAVAWYFLKKKGDATARAAANAPSSEGGKDIFEQLSGGLDQLLGRGKQNTTGISTPSTGRTAITVGSGSGSGAQLSGVAINAGPLVVSIAKGVGKVANVAWDAILSLSKRLHEELKPNPTTTNDQFIDAGLPISQSDLGGMAGNRAVSDESNFNLLQPSGFDYNPDPFDSQTTSFSDFA